MSSPLPVADMIRIMLVVGGGKQYWQKYDDGAMRAVASALRQLDCVEDRGASCVLGRVATEARTASAPTAGAGEVVLGPDVDAG